MKRFFFSFILLLGSIVLSFLLGSVWWSLWMNHGWFGASGIIAIMIDADGENAYDAMQLEMTLIIWLAFMMTCVLIWMIKCHHLCPEKWRE